MLSIYTDGSCKGNPGPGGWGFVIIKDNSIDWMAQGKKQKTTNNEMELTALYSALDFINTVPQSDNDFIIYSDSAYIVNCFQNQWYKKWLDNGWKTTTNKPVANKELWQKILNRFFESEHNISIRKVKGHADNKWNNIADMLAKGRLLNESCNKFVFE